MASNFNSFNSINAMNKIFKYLLGVLGIFFIGINLCNAGEVIYHGTGNYITRQTNMNGFDNGKNLCVNKIKDTQHYDAGQGITAMNNYEIYCFTGGTITLYPNGGTMIYNYVDLSLGCETCPTCPTIDSNYCTSNNLCPSCPSCPTCEEQYTSLECQTEYNLIPLSSVTQSYCELNFNLIDPSTCPISEGSGVVNWSSLFINNTQYAGNENIEIFIPDFIGWSIIYNSGSNYIDIEGYNADTEYIEDIIDKENMQPTNEDFAYLMQGLQVYAPYLFLFLLFAFTIWLVNKLFHHK